MWNVSHMPRHRAGALCVRLRRQRRRRPSHSSTLCSCTKATKRWRRSRRMQKEEDLFHFVTVFAMRVATKAQFVLCQPAAPIVNAAEPIYILFIARGVFAHCLPKASTYLHTHRHTSRLTYMLVFLHVVTLSAAAVTRPAYPPRLGRLWRPAERKRERESVKGGSLLLQSPVPFKL